MLRPIILLGIVSACTLSQAQPAVELNQKAPDFKATGIDGKEFSLSDKTKAGRHVALMFSRAHW